MAFDDLADRPHAADLLLDQNLGHTPSDYAGLVPPACRLLTGTRYALLREEFAAWREASLQRRAAQAETGYLKHILVNLGGVDKDNHTLAVLQAFSGSLPAACRVTVVMGKTAPHTAAVRAFADSAPYPCRVLVGADNMAELMAEADLAIGAAGSTSWERCCLGLPTLLLVIAGNQCNIAATLQTAGAALPLETSKINVLEFVQVWDYFRQPENLAAMSVKASVLCDGKGAVRVASHLFQTRK